MTPIKHDGEVRTVAQPNYKLANQKKECNQTSWMHVENSMQSMHHSRPDCY